MAGVCRELGVTNDSLTVDSTSDGYFGTPKDLRSVRDELGSKGVWTKPSALNVLLKEMTKRGEIHRMDDKGGYRYSSANTTLHASG